MISAGCKDFGTSHDLQCGEAQGGVRRGGQAAASFPSSLHSDPLRLHGEPDAGRERSHDHQRAAAQLAVDAAEGRRGGGVEGGDHRRQRRRGEGDDAAGALLRQRRQPPAGARRRFQILRLLQRAAAGTLLAFQP